MDRVKLVRTTAELDRELATAAKNLVVIFYFAPWCGPSKGIAGVVSEMSRQHETAVFLKVDIESSKDIATRHAVTATPTVQFFKSRVKIEEIVGADEHKLRSIMGSF
eukprot:m51a1_g609 putative thioredoxin 1 (107) ;mRNA; f:89558-89938